MHLEGNDIFFEVKPSTEAQPEHVSTRLRDISVDIEYCQHQLSGDTPLQQQGDIY